MNLTVMCSHFPGIQMLIYFIAGLCIAADWCCKLLPSCKNTKQSAALRSVCMYVPCELWQHAHQRPTLLGGWMAAVLWFCCLVWCWKVSCQVPKTCVCVSSWRRRKFSPTNLRWQEFISSTYAKKSLLTFQILQICVQHYVMLLGSETGFTDLRDFNTPETKVRNFPLKQLRLCFDVMICWYWS